MLKADPMFCRPFVPALVDSIIPGEAAYKAGIRKGDTIVKLGSKKIDTWGTFEYEISRMTDALTDAKTSRDSLSVLVNNVVWKKADGTMDTAQVTFAYQDERVLMGVVKSTIYNFYKPRQVNGRCEVNDL